MNYSLGINNNDLSKDNYIAINPNEELLNQNLDLSVCKNYRLRN